MLTTIQNLSVHTHPFIYLPVFLSVCLSARPHARPSVHPSIHPSVHPSIYLSSHLSIYSSIYLLIHPFIYPLSVCLHIYYLLLCLGVVQNDSASVSVTLTTKAKHSRCLLRAGMLVSRSLSTLQSHFLRQTMLVTSEQSKNDWCQTVTNGSSFTSFSFIIIFSRKHFRR